MRWHWVAVLVLLSMSVVPNTIAGEAMPDARDVFSESLSYLGLDKTGYAFFGGALFPELYEDTLSELPKSSRWTFLELTCTLDVKIISLAKENGLPYDRSWLLYWLPKSGEAIRPQDYVTILYHASFMPSDHRGIIDQGYEIGGFVPSYIMESVRSWDTRFRMNSLGYVFDVFSAEWILDPIAAGLSIPFLREELARYLGR